MSSAAVRCHIFLSVELILRPFGWNKLQWWMSWLRFTPCEHARPRRHALQSISYHATLRYSSLFVLFPSLLSILGPARLQTPACFHFPISFTSSGVRFWWMPLTLERPPRSPPLSLPTKFIRQCRTAPRDVWSGAQGESLSPISLAGRHQEGLRRTGRVLQTVGRDLRSSCVFTKITQGNKGPQPKLEPSVWKNILALFTKSMCSSKLVYSISTSCTSLCVDHLENWALGRLWQRRKLTHLTTQSRAVQPTRWHSYSKCKSLTSQTKGVGFTEAVWKFSETAIRNQLNGINQFLVRKFL